MRKLLDVAINRLWSAVEWVVDLMVVVFLLTIVIIVPVCFIATVVAVVCAL